MVRGALHISHWALQITFLFQCSLCTISSLWLSCDISNWDLLHSPPAAPGHAVLSTNSVLHLPSLKIVEFIWLLPNCLSCRLYYPILNSFYYIICSVQLLTFLSRELLAFFKIAPVIAFLATLVNVKYEYTNRIQNLSLSGGLYLTPDFRRREFHIISLPTH